MKCKHCGMESNINNKTYIIVKEEYKILMQKTEDALTKCIIEFIWKTGKKISETLTTFVYDKTINISLMHKINSIIKGKVFLFEKKDGTKYSRKYISNKIRLAGFKHISQIISAESLRGNPELC